MPRSTTIGWGLAFAGLLAVSMSCSETKPPRLRAPMINASSAGAAAIAMFDANKDGKLSGDELDKCPGLKAASAQLDPSGQGITADQITARINVWHDNRIGRLNVSCTVLHDGEPLEGAEVKFVPEKFLGPKMKVATGKTDQSGVASLSIPTSGQQYDPPGVPQGFYRVEITKPGLDIPAKYNTRTVLGYEVIYSQEMFEPLRFDLTF
jgi:hypothetical protein